MASDLVFTVTAPVVGPWGKKPVQLALSKISRALKNKGMPKHGYQKKCVLFELFSYNKLILVKHKRQKAYYLLYTIYFAKLM